MALSGRRTNESLQRPLDRQRAIDPRAEGLQLVVIPGRPGLRSPPPRRRSDRAWSSSAPRPPSPPPSGMGIPAGRRAARPSPTSPTWGGRSPRKSGGRERTTRRPIRPGNQGWGARSLGKTSTP
eukprot:1188689-Prorocentrum_minimum.AAC.3